MISAVYYYMAKGDYCIGMFMQAFIDKIIHKKRSFLSFIIFISLLFCALFGLQSESDFFGASKDISGHNPGYTFNIDNLVELVNAEELTLSATHIALIRQNEAGKNNIKSFGMDFIANIVLLQLIFTTFFLYNVYFDNILDSHRCIINYIHNKDGQKS
jgi:hypothetical protein